MMARFNKDIARANLSLLDVREFEIPIPPTEDEIEEVARALVTRDEKTATHERKRDQLKDLFRTLLHELMTANIRVNQIELDKPAADA
jgi:type I restriction enzyme S subunit